MDCVCVCVCIKLQRETEMDQEKERNTLHSNSHLSRCVVLKIGGGLAVIMRSLLIFFLYSLISLSPCLSCTHTQTHGVVGPLFQDLIIRHPGIVIITSSSIFFFFIEHQRILDKQV